MTDKLTAGDVGASIIINLGETNIPLSTDILVIVSNPYGATAEWVLEPNELNRTTGIITHKTKTGEIAYEGEYKVECLKKDTDVDLGSGVDYFKVTKRIL